MSKVLVLLILAALAALIAGGVIQVSFHPDKLSGLTATLSQLTQDQAALIKSKLLLIKAKRAAERLIIQDKEKRLEAAVLNVKEDADRLKNALTGDDRNPAQLLPYAELLLGSIKQVRTTAEEAPVDAVASLKQESTEAFAAAQEALGQLKDLHQEYEAINEEFNRLTDSLEKQIGSLDLRQEEEKDTSDDTNSSTPLRF
jgi:septal ring factor EnvC (AmiA/AmiB activator)